MPLRVFIIGIPLAYVTLPGITSGVLALITGIVAYKKEGVQNIFCVILGLIAVCGFGLELILAGGSPFACVSNFACTDQTSCVQDNGNVANVLNPGACFYDGPLMG